MSNERHRGFYPAAVTNFQGLANLVDHFKAAQAAAEVDPETTRMSMRAVVENRLIPYLGRAVDLEAALPLARTPDRHIVYAAWNDPRRRATEEALQGHHALIGNIQTSRAVSTEDPLIELAAKGYKPNVIDNGMTAEQRLALKARFFGLYSKFNFDSEDVEELLLNPNNTIAYIDREDGTVVSTALTERAIIPVKGQPGDAIAIAEITEAVTDPIERGNGLYRALSKFLANHVTAHHQSGLAPLDALYGESNLSSPGVIVAAHRNGRRFSRDDATALGIDYPHFGILQQNVAVNDGNETRPYNDFALTYIDLGQHTEQ